MHNGLLLLKTLLSSTSQRNIYKHCKDRKKRRKIVGGAIGAALIFVMIMAYCVAVCVGYGHVGLIDAAPVMCALVISTLAFFFTVFKTNGYLFNFKEYDMLMSLPLEARTVAACKFTYMYVKSLPWYLSISLAMLIGYGYFARPAFAVYPVWIALGFFLPVIPMLIAAFLGFLITKATAGLRKTNIVQTILIMIFIVFCFSLRFIIDEIFSTGKVESTLEQASQMTDSAAGIYLPVRWFANAVTSLSEPGMLLSGVLSMVLLVGVSVALFAIVFLIVGNSYQSINSALKSHAASKKYKMEGQKKRSVVNAIAFKEFRRMTGSTNYMVNAGMGEILAVLLGILMLIVGFDRIIGVVTHDAPFDHAIIYPAIPFIVYFFVGMMATTACSPSLEGKNYWILQSLPIEKGTIFKGKMLFNLYLTVPAMVVATLCLCISAKIPAVDTVLYLILGFALCAFSTAWGCVCGVRHMRLDWENEIEVIKQSAGVTIYLLPNMFAVMALSALVVFLGMKMDHHLLTMALIVIVTLLAALSYRRVLALARR